MTKEEMRFLRRELITEYLTGDYPLSALKYYVRFLERVNYGYELKAYT